MAGSTIKKENIDLEDQSENDSESKDIKILSSKEYLEEKKQRQADKVMQEKEEKETHQQEEEKMYKNSVSNSQKYTFFDSIMTGLGENYIQAFGAFLKATDFQFSLLVSLPQFIGGFIQLFTFNILNVFKTRRVMNIFFTILQSLIWIPVMFLLFSHTANAAWVFIFLVTVYFSISLVINPIWNSWIMDIVSTEDRGSYFGKRSLIVNLVLFVAFISGGIFLYFSNIFYGNEIWGYALIFLLSVIFNLVAAYYLIKTYEPRYVLVKPRISLAKFVMGIKRDNQGWIILYLVLMAFAVAVSSPFYTLYLLKSLKMNYIEYAILIMTPILARILFVKKVGAIVDKYGPKKLLKISSFLIVFNPILWLFGKSFLYLFFAQFYSGIAYAIFEMCSITYLMNSTSSEDRISLLTYYNFFNGGFVLLGALCSNFALNIGPYSNLYLNAFLISGILRLIVLLIPFPKVPEKDVYQKSGYSQLTKEIASMVAPEQMMKKTVAARDKESIRILDNNIVRKKPSSGYYAGKEDIEVIKDLHKKGEHEKLAKSRQGQQQAKHFSRGAAIKENIYMCHSCSSEFKTINKAHVGPCPYCASKDIIFLRDNIRIIQKELCH